MKTEDEIKVMVKILEAAKKAMEEGGSGEAVYDIGIMIKTLKVVLGEEMGE